MYSVTFLPDNRIITVDESASLLDAAEQAGVHINRLCGGDGVCGRCKVIVNSGDVWAEATMHLSREEVQAGYVLACRCYPRGDVVIEVPAASRLEGKPKPTSEDTLRFSATRVLIGEEGSYPHAPLSRKVSLPLPPPCLEDNLADYDRLARELRRETPIPVLQIGLAQLRQLPALMREHNWQVTATLGLRGGTEEDRKSVV